MVAKKQLETYHRSCFVCLLKACFSPFKRIETWDTPTTISANSRGEKNDVAIDALPMWPPCQWWRQKIRVLTGRPGAPCRMFFSPSPQMPTQPTGAANRGGGEEAYVDQNFMLRNRQLQKGEWKWSPKFKVKSSGNHHHVATHDLFWCVLWLDKGWPRSKLSDAAN